MKTIAFNGHKNIIHSRLVQERERLGLSQQNLAEKMQVFGVSIDQQAISKIELDKRIVTDYELICICKVLRIDVSQLTIE